VLYVTQNMRRIQALGHDIVDINERLALPISKEAIESLLYHYHDEDRQPAPFTADDIAWDLYRLFGNEGGLDLYLSARWMFDDEDDNTYEYEADAVNSWSAFARPRGPSDKLFIDLADDAIHDGWPVPPELAPALERLRDLADHRREQIDPPSYDPVSKAKNAALFAWDRLGEALEKHSVIFREQTARSDKYMFEHPDDDHDGLTPEDMAIHEAALKANQEAREAFEKAKVNLENVQHAKDMKEGRIPMPSNVVPLPLPPVPGPSNRTSMIGGIRPEPAPPEYGETSIADRFVNEFGTRLSYIKSRKQWLYWDGKRWIVDNKGFVQDLAVKHCKAESALCASTPGYTAANARTVCSKRTVEAVLFSPQATKA
jgi:hypothetical protein